MTSSCGRRIKLTNSTINENEEFDGPLEEVDIESAADAEGSSRRGERKVQVHHLFGNTLIWRCVLVKRVLWKIVLFAKCVSNHIQVSLLLLLTI